MRSIARFACLLLALATAGGLAAEERDSAAFEGVYLLVQHDGYQRTLSLEPGGIASQVSDQEALLGYSGAQGAWRLTGPERARVRLIDFSHETEGGQPLGPALIVYDLSFAELASGKYRKVSGRFAGKQYAAGQNPLNPTEPPVRSFGVAFQGQRISAE
jgi:hypothetical protein